MVLLGVVKEGRQNVMKLYVTPTSPYARLALIVRLQKGLSDRVEVVWTRTRNPEDPLLEVNPSGRIPFLQLPDGSGFEDTDVIVDYFDALSAPRQFVLPHGEAYWPFRQAMATARSMLDGVSVWARERTRPDTEQSPTVIEHERQRAARLAGHFETAIDRSPFSDGTETGRLNMPQLLLFCALDVERRLPEFDWQTGHPRLSDWHTRIEHLPTVSGSLPPANP